MKKIVKIKGHVKRLLNMKHCYYYGIILMTVWFGCKTKENKVMLPDLKPNFYSLLHKRDSTLLLDSFYFVRIDTMTEKKALTHQRFSFKHIMENINSQLGTIANKKDSFHLAPSSNDISTIEYLRGEKIYVQKEIDSINTMIVHADSVRPIGYQAFYSATVRKINSFVITDTFPYSITLKMKISDWDRNVEKTIDALATGKRPHSTDH